jgi:hypothetical protein
MAAKKKHRSTHEYLRYLKGKLAPEERYSIDRDLEADPFDREALEGMEQISADALEEDLLSIHASLQKRLSRKRRLNWYYVAAGVASILIVGTVFINIYDINPKIVSESIPSDESFLHEDNGMQREEKSEDLIMEELVPDSDVPVLEMQEREERGRAMETREKALDDRIADEMAADETVVEYETLDMDAEAPAAVAREEDIREVVAVEAQPKRSRKKDRAIAPVEEPVAERVEAPADALKEARVVEQKAYVSGRISGIVVSAEDMEPLPGASLLVKGSDSGMVADLEGRFAFVSDKQEPETLIASYVGMVTDEYMVEEGFDNQVLMLPDQVLLSEVVVIGYDADKSLYPTGAVQRVNLEPEEITYRGAEPEGGLQAFKMYIEEHIRFPAGDSLSKREVVVLKFNVALDGSISNIQPLRSPGMEFTEAAIRLLQEGPVWNPAQNENGDTEDVVRMRIVFKK